MSKRIFHLLKTKRDSIGPIFRLNRAKYTKPLSTLPYAGSNNGQNGGPNNDYIIAAAVVLLVYIGVKTIH